MDCCVGAAGGCAGAGAVGFAVEGAAFLAGAGVEDCVCSRIEPVLNDPVGARFTESVSEVIMNTMAHHVVARERNVAAPRGPNAVWLPMPPKAAVMSPLLPLCSSTTMIRNKQTMI